MISRIIFKNKMTIVNFEDGTKTVCTCQEGDTYDREKAVFICMLKRMLGNSMFGRFGSALGEWIDDAEKHGGNEIVKIYEGK